jgi:hypothetical protein
MRVGESCLLLNDTGRGFPVRSAVHASNRLRIHWERFEMMNAVVVENGVSDD